MTKPERRRKGMLNKAKRMGFDMLTDDLKDRYNSKHEAKRVLRKHID